MLVKWLAFVQLALFRVVLFLIVLKINIDSRVYTVSSNELGLKSQNRGKHG